MATERPPEADEREREREQGRLERLIPELIKRVVEAGYDKLSESTVRQLVSDMKLPKEALAMLFSQIDETKNGLYRAVAREVRDFLEQTNFAEELAKVLTTLSFEIKTEVRFIPNDARLRASPEVKTKVKVRRDRAGSPESEPAPGSQPSKETPGDHPSQPAEERNE